MINPFITDRIYKDEKFKTSRLPKGDYDSCTFIGCDFSEGYLDNSQFLDCRFEDCNFSNTNIAHTTFKDVEFVHCKMIGLHFETCNPLLMSFSFQDCTLDLSSFTGVSIPGTVFYTCKLREVDFSEADLSRSRFDHSLLDNALFVACNLQQADFSLANNFNIDPERNQVKGACFSRENIIGLLRKYQIKVLS